MMIQIELEKYFEQHKLSEATRDYIRPTRGSKPSRLIGVKAASNVCTWFASRKMGRTIQAESRTAEFPFVIEFEYDDRILEFWDQPQPMLIERSHAGGSRRAASYIPDFLVLSVDGPYVVEIKTKEDLAKLLKEKPEDWQMTEDGAVYVPARDAFVKIGLRHCVRTTEELNPIRTANLRILLQARNTKRRVTPQERHAVKQVLGSQAWMTLQELADRIGAKDFGPILQLINSRELYADIEEHLLSDPQSVWVASSPALLALSRENRKNSALYQGLAKKDIDLPVELAPSEKQATKALQMLKRIENGEKGRTVRRWKRRIEAGRKQGLAPWQALSPKYHLRGNRLQRISQKCLEYLDEFIKHRYATVARMTAWSAYRQYKYLAKQEDSVSWVVSWPTFREYLMACDQVSLARKRGGRRAANAKAAPISVRHRELRATLPFELAAIDHYKADVMCAIASANGKEYAVRPWVTAMVDLCTGAILAVSVSLKDPSTSACARLLRECVRRHGRLPAGIIADRGSDFMSVYFSSRLARFGVDLVLRPAAFAKFGAQVERFFGVLKTQWISTLPGNLVSLTERRAISSSHAPEKNASLSLEEFVTGLLKFVEIKNAELKTLRYKAPGELLQQGQQQFPCVGPVMVEDEAFTIATAVPAHKYKVDPTRGIHGRTGLHYWHPALADLKVRQRPEEVRIEPEDPYRIYALVNNKWVTCLATGERQFETRDPVARLAEAIRVYDGPEALKQAKEDAEQALMEHVLNPEKKATPDRADTQPPKIVEESIFSTIPALPLQQLDVSEWGGEV